jgi:hypothetical protein
VTELQGVRSPGKLYDDGIIGSLRGVVVVDLAAKPRRLNTNGGIDLGIKIGRPPINFCCDLIFLDVSARGLNFLLRQVAKKPTKRL